MIKKEIIVPTWAAYISALAVIFVGFIWTTFFTEAPYTAMVGGVTGLTGGYFMKRSSDKKQDEVRASRIDIGKQENIGD